MAAFHAAGGTLPKSFFKLKKNPRISLFYVLLCNSTQTFFLINVFRSFYARETNNFNKLLTLQGGVAFASHARPGSARVNKGQDIFFKYVVSGLLCRARSILYLILSHIVVSSSYLFFILSIIMQQFAPLRKIRSSFCIFCLVCK